MNAVLNRHAPKIEPKGIKAVEAESEDPAIIAVKTSGAPLANAKNVTPANVGDISWIIRGYTEFINKLLNCFGQVIIINEVDESEEKVE